MKILFVGDVIGRPGRRLLRERLSEVQQAHHVDFTIVNVENAAGGFGINPVIAEEILALGVDVMTSGNHIWDKSEVIPYLSQQPRLIRPANYPPGTPGQGQWLGESRSGTPVAVVNLQGRVFMPLIDCPFQAATRIVSKVRRQTPVILVDFHAEATSEKMALGWHLDGQVSAVMGTHTHIPTCDTRVLPGGTGYITDVGMTGPYDSVIGMQIEGSLNRFLSGRSARFSVAKGSTRFSSVLIDVDEETGQSRSIRRLDRDGD